MKDDSKWWARKVGKFQTLKKAVDGKTRWETGSLFYGHFAVELSCGFGEVLVEVGRILRLLDGLSPGRLRQILRLVARAGSVAERDVRYIFMISICSVTCVFHLGNFYRFMEFARVLFKQNIFLELQRFYRIRFIYLSSILKWM